MEGIIIGVVTFFLIGIFHPLVIKGEYYFGRKVNKFFILFGVIFVALSLYIKSLTQVSLLVSLSVAVFGQLARLLSRNRES